MMSEVAGMCQFRDRSCFWRPSGRPGPRRFRQRHHLLRGSSRCQRRRVSGVTRKVDQRARGRNRLRAAKIARTLGPVPDPSVEPPFEEAHLVAEPHDLDLVVGLGPPAGDDEAEEPAEAEVEEREGHGRLLPEVAGKGQFRPRSHFWRPSPTAAAPPVIQIERR